MQMLLLADAFDMGQYRRAAGAHELNLPAIAALAECDDARNCFGGLEWNVEKNQIGRAPLEGRKHSTAVGKFLSVDSGAMQNQRQKKPDARIGVDDEAERSARLGAVYRRNRGCNG